MSEQFLGLSFAELIQRIQKDRQFGNDFEALVLDVTRHENKLNSEAGQLLLRHFAKDADELAQLTATRETLDDVLANNRVRTVPTTHTGTYTTGTAMCTPEEQRLVEAGFSPPGIEPRQNLDNLDNRQKVDKGRRK